VSDSGRAVARWYAGRKARPLPAACKEYTILNGGRCKERALPGFADGALTGDRIAMRLEKAKEGMKAIASAGPMPPRVEEWLALQKEMKSVLNRRQELSKDEGSFPDRIRRWFHW
jgi:hypothetical protein